MLRVFLGGTVNNSNWREPFKKMLKIDYFDPVVENWDDTSYRKEFDEKFKCDFCLYVITPKISGYYSIAEVVDESNKYPQKTLFCILTNDGGEKFSAFQLKSLHAVGKIIENNGGKWFKNLDDVANYLNGFYSSRL